MKNADRFHQQLKEKKTEVGCPSCLYLRLREEVDELARRMVHGTEEEVTDHCALTANLISGIVNSLDQWER